MIVSKRVVVTGLGVVSPLGNSVGEFWTNLCAGRSGVGPITLFDASHFKTRIAAEIRNVEQLFAGDQKSLRRLDRFAIFALAAAREAWRNAQLDGILLDHYQSGVLIGSSHGGETTVLEQVERAFWSERGPVSPLLIPRMLNNMASAQVARELGLHGPVFGISSACATAAHSIGEAAEIIKRGDAQVMLCGGAEACITPLTLAGDQAAGALSRRNDAPEEASRPFDAQRDGFILGEGAGVLVLEELSHAEARGVHIFGELAGYGATCDAFHEVRPAPDGVSAAHAIKRAMEKGSVAPPEVSAVFAHATSTRAGDRAEVQALKLSLGEALSGIPVTAIKSMTGHLLGAAGALQGIAALKALQEQLVPPTINYVTPDPECDIDCVPTRRRAVQLRHVLCPALGFGGHNACLLYSCWPHHR